MPEPTAQVQDSILHDVKQMAGLEWDDPTYDLDIKNHINSIFSDLNQIGVGPENGFEITDHTTLWDEYIGPNKNLNAVKSYIHNRMRLLFDPPTNGFLVTSIEKQIEKSEWRLMVLVDPPLSST